MSKIEKQLLSLRQTSLYPSFPQTQPHSYLKQNKSFYNKLDPIYRSSSPAINRNYIMYTSPSHNNYNTQKINLALPKKQQYQHRYHIQKEISAININCLGIQNKSTSKFDELFPNTQRESSANKKGFYSYRNRPMSNITHRQYSFSAKKYMQSSPTNRAVFSAKLFESKNADPKEVMFNKNKTSRNNKAKLKILKKEMIMNNNDYDSMEMPYGKNFLNKLNNGCNKKDISKDEHECNLFIRELSFWPNKKVQEWKHIY
jgi:hypothetical protein